MLYDFYPETKEELYSQYSDEKFMRKISGGGYPTTNQIMEVKAVIESLKMINNPNIPIYIMSDSAYLINCMNQSWWNKWMNNGWINSQKKPVSNKELWIELIELVSKFIEIHWVKVLGHSGIYYNELADSLAGKETDKLKKRVDKGLL